MSDLKASKDIVFWQEIVSPHMVPLASSLALMGHRVTYVFTSDIPDDRVQLGWKNPDVDHISILKLETKEKISALIDLMNDETVHVCQGIRGNDLVSYAQKLLRKKNFRYWVVMETVNDAMPLGLLKKIIYRYLLQRNKKFVNGILSIGRETKDWVANRNFPVSKIFKFSYFLSDLSYETIIRSGYDDSDGRPFRFVFVGALNPRKNLQLLLKALEKLEQKDFELWVVGVGPDRKSLEKWSEDYLGDKVKWLGGVPIDHVPQVISKCDCLVLPSVHDGWGAVVAEALMVGVPCVCSDKCGASELVLKSGNGAVFANKDIQGLHCALVAQLKRGKVKIPERLRVANWATCIGGKSGANYFSELVDNSCKSGQVSAPWES